MSELLHLETGTCRVACCTGEVSPAIARTAVREQVTCRYCLSQDAVMEVNHDEAWSLACYKREGSNLARCYMDAIETLRSLGYEITLRGDLKKPTSDEPSGGLAPEQSRECTCPGGSADGPLGRNRYCRLHGDPVPGPKQPPRPPGKEYG